MKFNKRNWQKTKTQMITQFLISSSSWAINKCWMTISSASSKDLQVHKTLIWTNSIWFTKMLLKDCQFLKLSPQILQLLGKMSKHQMILNSKDWWLILRKNMLSLKQSCKQIWELKLNIKLSKEWPREPRCIKSININNIRRLIRCNNKNTITPSLFFRPRTIETPPEYRIIPFFKTDLWWFKFTHRIKIIF